MKSHIFALLQGVDIRLFVVVTCPGTIVDATIDPFKVPDVHVQFVTFNKSSERSGERARVVVTVQEFPVACDTASLSNRLYAPVDVQGKMKFWTSCVERSRVFDAVKFYVIP